jgi:hypothetical protein
LLADINLKHIRVEAAPPYVALIDSQCWGVELSEVLHKLCTKDDIKVQHLILKHVDTEKKFRCFNAHMPSKYATDMRKEDCVKRMCYIATDSADQQRTGCIPWIIAGDLNVDSGTMGQLCQSFIEKKKECLSKSEWPQDVNAQKADFALSQGIDLVIRKSWVGYHSPPCASDVHDAVVVAGAFQAIDSGLRFTAPPLPNSVWSKRAGVTSQCKSTPSTGTASGSGVLQPATHDDDAEKAALDTSAVHADIQDVIEDDSAPRKRLAEEVAPTTSGVLQPAVQANIEKVIEQISLSAGADNGTLLQGDSPDASRSESPRRRYAAQQLLEMFYNDQGGYAVRPQRELLLNMAIPIRVREDMVDRIANYRQGVYSKQELFDWYNNEPLPEIDFKWALDQWKEEFPMNENTRKRIHTWRDENTRESKKNANQLRNGAFKAFLQQECMNVQFALALLKHPTAMVNTLLEAWAQYLESPEYLKEKARSQKLDESNAEAVSEKQRHLELKMRVHHLRHQVRLAKALHRNPKAIADNNRKLYEEWLSGSLGKKLDECTRVHGYGKLQSTGEMLESSGFWGGRRKH